MKSQNNNQLPTQGEYKQGRLLSTNITRSWPKEEKDRIDAIERKMVFTNFKQLDGGRSRNLICTAEKEEDAKAICSAINNTYQKGINPEAVEVMNQAINHAKRVLGAIPNNKKSLAFKSLEISVKSAIEAIKKDEL